MAVCLLPGIATADAYGTTIVLAPATQTAVQGTTVYLTATLTSGDSGLNGTDVGTAANSTWSVTDPAGSCDKATPVTVGSVNYIPCVFNTVGTWTVFVTDVPDTYVPGSATVTVTAAGVQSFSVMTGNQLAIPPSDAETVGTADTLKVCALDINAATLTGYVGTIRFSSSDPLATLPAQYTYVAADAGCHTFSVTFGTTAYQTVTVNDTTALAMYGVTRVFVFLPSEYLYHPLDTPVRIIDTRIGLGLSGPLQANVGVSFPVAAGLSSIPYCVVAVTGNLTVVNATSGWAVYLGPNVTNTPTTSAINFNAGQVVGNSLTVAVNQTTGYVAATYISTAGNTANIVFDVTGYYGSEAACHGGSFYHALNTPVRVLDTRNNTGYAGKLTAGLPATFEVAGYTADYGIPSNATAVTGNLTVVNSTCGWAAYLGPDPTPIPATSTVNFTAGQIVGNGVTVALGGSGDNYLSATYIGTPGCTTDLVFDVTGYYDHSLFNNNEDTATRGLRYVPMAPARVLDTRIGLGASTLSANLPMPFQVAGTTSVPSNAYAVTGNVTVVNETAGWAVYLGAAPLAQPLTSNINFLAGQVLGNGTTVGLHTHDPAPAGERGMLNATYISNSGNTTDLVFDVTGYFIHEAPLASPTLSTKPSGTVPVGGILSDQATLNGAVGPTGSVTFKLYGPNDLTCSSAAIDTWVVALSGTSATTSPAFTTLAAGTYKWTASYPGDSQNNPATSVCGEATDVTPFTPTLVTVANSGTGDPIELQDIATLSGAFGTPSGKMTFNLYSDPGCTSLVTYGFPDDETVSGNVTDSAPYAAYYYPGAIYYWQVSYSGDTNNSPVASTCGDTSGGNTEVSTVTGAG